MSTIIDGLAQKLHELTKRNGGKSRGSSDMREDAAALASFISSAGFIPWQPIGEIPFALKGSGNYILLWADGAATVGHWSDSGPLAGDWLDHDGEPTRPSHYARLSEPA